MRIADILSKAKVDKKSLEAEVLLAFSLKKSKEWVIAHDDFELSIRDVKGFHELWTRFLQSEPVAYLVNKKEFFAMDFYVDGRVLIPRPETESLVSEVLDLSQGPRFASKKVVRVVDVGTGCAAISISLAKNSKNLEIYATEVSEVACEVARKNIEDLGAKVDLRCGDLLEPVKDVDFDIIVANLPYIGTEKYNFVETNVTKYEPNVALYGGNDGLELYRKLFVRILDYGMKPSYILGEFGFLHAEILKEDIKKYFPKAVYTVKQDLSGLDRNFIISL
ncbi:MAG: protein methyltransferase HemK, release factor glutamine methyltransferase [Candidatus Peregrinibacteria bacterium GW2011_GWF2_43_17]|nr:MAG: protein methyltransferase HemK, release factor glutamine methyltransferase [Candidatus Peregrinibacteria bacterium GW2011_GWF2_43_17]KKT20333.1 MAG: Release factor glutamine methyltransferase [Candidatus Peregrinibacteria bacterium GW2011_GWA2_43_8]HAU39412.1 peptide chain release factor N(5)-glutamine methyltransferase [Candidatus Peregrinibacteria bacterium]